MIDAVQGRMARCQEDAESFLFAFIAAQRHLDASSRDAHNHEYDLYLPWLIEVVSNARAESAQALPLHDLQVLYMDAAWALCLRGLLRPGPRVATAMNDRDSLGKGYSLTPQGHQRLARWEARGDLLQA